MFKPRGKVESMRMKITKNEAKTYSIEYNCNLKAGSQAGEKGHSKCMTNRIVLLYSVIIVISVSNIYVPLTHIHNNKRSKQNASSFRHYNTNTHFSSKKCSLTDNVLILREVAAQCNYFVKK